MKYKSERLKKAISTSNYFLLLLFVFWLPLKDDYLPLIMALWIFTWLLDLNFSNHPKSFPEKKYFLGFLIYFFLTVIFLFRSNINDGLFEIQEKLSMVFFPIILFGSNQKIKKNTDKILVIFVLGNVIASICCLVNALNNSLTIENGNYVFNHLILGQTNIPFWEAINLKRSHFSYTELSIFKHTSYFAIYLNLSILILIQLLKNSQLSKKWVIVGLILIVFFLCMIYLLQSRAGLITLIITLLFISIIELKKKLKKRYLFITIIILCMSGAGAILMHPRIHNNLIEVKEITNNEIEMSKLKSDIRLQLWYTSIKVIEENFWFGTSPANVTNELVKKYKELGFDKAADDELNTHSQYLETFAGLGIFGFLSLIYIIVYTFIISVKKKHYLLFFLMIILSINFLFEAMLNRMAGVLFMMFFISLLVFIKKPVSKNASTDTRTNDENEGGDLAVNN